MVIQYDDFDKDASLIDYKKDRIVSESSDIELAGHLVTPRILYTHHGLYIGNNMVVQRSREGVNVVNFEEFAEGYEVYLRTHETRKYTKEESVIRGLSLVGEEKYNVLFNNCEHFVSWCIDGIKKSEQVRELFIAAENLFEYWYKNRNREHIFVDLLKKSHVIERILQNGCHLPGTSLYGRPLSYLRFNNVFSNNKTHQDAFQIQDSSKLHDREGGKLYDKINTTRKTISAIDGVFKSIFK